MKRILRDKAGMSLIELMLATGILAGTMTAVFTSLVAVSVIGTTNESRTRASLALASILEEINVLPFSDVLKYAPPATIKTPGVSHQITVEMLLSAQEDDDESSSQSSNVTTVSLPVATGYNTSQIPNPVEVRVTLAWQEANGRVYQVRASTIKGKVP